MEVSKIGWILARILHSGLSTHFYTTINTLLHLCPAPLNIIYSFFAFLNDDENAVFLGGGQKEKIRRKRIIRGSFFRFPRSKLPEITANDDSFFTNPRLSSGYTEQEKTQLHTCLFVLLCAWHHLYLKWNIYFAIQWQTDSTAANKFSV